MHPEGWGLPRRVGFNQEGGVYSGGWGSLRRVGFTQEGGVPSGGCGGKAWGGDCEHSCST